MNDNRVSKVHENMGIKEYISALVCGKFLPNTI